MLIDFKLKILEGVSQNLRSILQKVYEWWYYSFAKMILSLGDNFDTQILFDLRLFWYLAHSQILGISLYFCKKEIQHDPLMVQQKEARR